MDRMVARLPGELRAGRWSIEIALVIAVAVAIDLQVGVAFEGGAAAPGAPGFVLGALMALVLLGRRRWPLGVLMAVTALLVIYNLVLDLPGFSPVVPCAVPLYCAARAGRLWWAGLTAIIALTATLLFMLVKDHLTLATALSRVVLDAALLGALLMLGEILRGRRALADEMRRAAVRVAVEREAEANRKVTEERLHIARELHDVLAHTLAGAAVQAGVAADTLTDDFETSRAAIDAVRGACREARAELTATLGVLRAGGLAVRDETAGSEPVPRIENLPSLLDVVRSTGPRVELSITGEQVEIPPAVSLATFRIVQESLTNVVRHARARSVVVSLNYGAGTLAVSIIDDGAGAYASPTKAQPGGFGLIGMRERAVSIGGQFSAGVHPAGGYQVVATLPILAKLETVS